MSSTAILSPDGLYRYELERDVPGNECGPTLGVFGVNPSTADASLEDPTTRRIAGFARLLGFGRYLLGNEFAYRATDVKALAALPLDVAIGPFNDECIRRIMGVSHTILFAWGPLAKLPPRLRNRWKDMVRMADDACKVPMCLGVAQDGHPRHPLMLPYSAPMVAWPVPWFPNRVPLPLPDGFEDTATGGTLAPWEEERGFQAIND
jgi:hypothetical protein